MPWEHITSVLDLVGGGAHGGRYIGCWGEEGKDFLRKRCLKSVGTS